MVEQIAPSRLHIGMPAPDIALTTVRNELIHVNELWSYGPTLLTFLRHFGWLFCREWLAQLELHHNKITDAGLQIVGVAMGQPKHAKRYCGNLAPSMMCLTDETTLPYQTYGLQQGKLTELMSPAVVTASVRALTRGSSVGKTVGDVRMLPGTFIIDREGIIRYTYYSKHAGDHPGIADLITVADTMR